MGVIIDKSLSWIPHIENLNKKLKCNSGMLNKIKDQIPSTLYKTLYHTLFESDLAYAITVWGGISMNKLKPIFTTQKMCIRIMFGDKATYLNKFKTCARIRPRGTQVLGKEFYTKEHTKPLFNQHGIFVVQNLYYYHSILSIFKILKTHIPISLYSCFTKSQRKAALLVMPQHSHHFVYKASSLWNEVINNEQFSSINDFSAGLSQVKTCLKKMLHQRQSEGDRNEWSDENFLVS